MVSVMVSVMESKVGFVLFKGALNCLFDDCVMVMVMVMVSITETMTETVTETITETITITGTTQLLQCRDFFFFGLSEWLELWHPGTAQE